MEQEKTEREGLLEFLNAYAREAIEQAMCIAGRTWEWEPETHEIAHWTPEYCDDCGAWHSYWITLGFRVEGGEVSAIRWVFETDDVQQVYATLIPNVAEINRIERAQLREAMDAQIEYYTDVAEVGADPLGEFANAPWRKNTLAERAEEAIASCRSVLERLAEMEADG